MDSSPLAPADPPVAAPGPLVAQPFLDGALAILAALMLGVVIAVVQRFRTGHFDAGNSTILIVLSEAPFLLIGLWRVRRNLRKQLLADAVFTGDLKRAVALGFATGAGILLLGVALISALAGIFGSKHLPRVLEDMLAGATGWKAAVVLTVVALIGPIAEEVFFRAGMFAPLFASGRFWLGAVLSSALFSVAHGNLLLAPYYFILGVILCGVFAATRNLAAPIVAHITLNGTACLMFVLSRAYNLH